MTGNISELDDESTTTAGLRQAHLSTSRVVKTFNHIYATQVTVDGQTAGSMSRLALMIAGEDADAKAVVTKLLDEFGFDTVDVGPLKEGWRVQRVRPGYGPRRTAEIGQRSGGRQAIRRSAICLTRQNAIEPDSTKSP